MGSCPLNRAGLRRRGLTLAELVVVMAILVALAGIVIPLLPGLIGRAETSARATNSGEIYKWIQTYEASYTHYPSDWDALSDGSTTPLSWLGFKVDGSGALATTSITNTAQIAALRSAGVTRLQLFATTVPSGTNITFNPYADLNDRNSATGALPITSTTTTLNCVTLTPAGQFQLNLSDNATSSSGVYVVFGFGKRASIVGTGVLEPPVNFFDNSGLSPDTRYSRYGVVFQVNGTDISNNTQIDFSRAKLVRVVRFGNSLSTGDDAIKSYWDDVTTGGGS